MNQVSYKKCDICGKEGYLKQIYICQKCNENKDEVEKLQEYINDNQFDIIKDMQYKNLRLHFNMLVHYILGDDYYNLANDVYASDELCCNDILAAYLQEKNKPWYIKLKEWFK